MLSEILVLGSLARGPHHGYDINRSIEQALGTDYRLNANTLYPLLRRCLAAGLVNREIQPQSGKPDRHIYSLTPVGLKSLRDLLLDFPDRLAFRVVEFRARVIYFDLLPAEECHIIIARRRSALLTLIEHYYQRQRQYAGPYSARIADLDLSLYTEELRWLDTLDPSHISSN